MDWPRPFSFVVTGFVVTPPPQDPGGAGSRLLCPGPASQRAGGGLRGAGDGATLPPLHLERLLPQASLRGGARAARHRALPLPGRHGDGAGRRRQALKDPAHLCLFVCFVCLFICTLPSAAIFV